MLIVNTPHNPVGKVYTKTELEFIAALAQEFNFMVMSDEVVGITMQPRTCMKSTFCSMTVSSSTAKNIIASPLFPACGSEL